MKRTIEDVMQEARMIVNEMPFKINWNNKNLGRAWFEIKYDKFDLYYIAMGVNGITKGWIMDLSNLSDSIRGYLVSEEKANELKKELYNWLDNCLTVKQPSWINERDIEKYIKVNHLFYENYRFKQGKKESIYPYELKFLDN